MSDALAPRAPMPDSTARTPGEYGVALYQNGELLGWQDSSVIEDPSAMFKRRAAVRKHSAFLTLRVVARMAIKPICGS